MTRKSLTLDELKGLLRTPLCQ